MTMSPLNTARFFTSMFSNKLHFGSLKQFAIANFLLLLAKSKAHLKNNIKESI